MIPEFVQEGPWVGLFAFLTVVVFLRAQGTYWVGWVARMGTEAVARGDATPRLARLAARFSGPGMDRARAFLERWGFVGIPFSFLTIGFQTLVNAAAGFTRMRWDLYTAAMIPGCLMWAALYATVGVSIYRAFVTSPALGVGVLVAIVALGYGATRLRRNAGSAAHTPR